MQLSAISGVKRAFPEFSFDPFGAGGNQAALTTAFGAGVYGGGIDGGGKIPRAGGTNTSGFNTAQSTARRINFVLPVKCLDPRNPNDDPTLALRRGMVIFCDIVPIYMHGYKESPWHFAGRFMPAPLGVETQAMAHVTLNMHLHMEGLNPSDGKLPPTVDEVYRRWPVIGVVSSEETEAAYRTSVRSVTVDVISFYGQFLNVLSNNLRAWDNIFVLYVPVPIDMGSSYILMPNSRNRKVLDARAVTNLRRNTSTTPTYRVMIQYCVHDGPRMDPRKLLFPIPTGKDCSTLVKGHATRVASIKSEAFPGAQVCAPEPCATQDPKQMRYQHMWTQAPEFSGAQLLEVITTAY